MPLSQYDRDHISDLVAGEGSWFTAQLIRLIAKADVTNRARLAQAFPEEVEAYKKWYYGEAAVDSAEAAREDYEKGKWEAEHAGNPSPVDLRQHMSDPRDPNDTSPMPEGEI